jgi:hypothetical protein
MRKTTTLCNPYITHFVQPNFMEFLGFQNKHPKFPSIVNKPHHMFLFFSTLNNIYEIYEPRRIKL